MRHGHTVKVEDDVWRTLKVQAAARDISLGELLESFILKGLRNLDAPLVTKVGGGKP